MIERWNVCSYQRLESSICGARRSQDLTNSEAAHSMRRTPEPGRRREDMRGRREGLVQ